MNLSIRKLRSTSKFPRSFSPTRSIHERRYLIGREEAHPLGESEFESLSRPHDRGHRSPATQEKSLKIDSSVRGFAPRRHWDRRALLTL